MQHYLPATAPDDVQAWQQTVVAFLAEKERRSGSRRTVESYARMLWPLLTRVGSPDLVTPAHVLAWAYGIGASGREPSSANDTARRPTSNELTANRYLARSYDRTGRVTSDDRYLGSGLGTPAGDGTLT
jgi:hypothetical protein